MKAAIQKLIALSAAVFASATLGQNISQSSADIEQQKQAQALTTQIYQASLNTNQHAGVYAAGHQLVPEGLRPFGAQLFDGGFSGVRSDGLNPAYKITPGDQVVLRAWGAIELDRVMPVDSQGNIFIPSIGPVQVQGVSHGQLDQIVRAAVKTIYPHNVNVYTNLIGVQPVAVYVTGFVNSPGRYAGTPNDSALYFLHAAGGISAATGSYRNIQVKRGGDIVKKIDLYDFIQQGDHPDFQFEDGDTLFVGNKTAAVTIEGDVQVPAIYEPNLGATVEELLYYAKPIPASTSVLVRGYRDNKPFSKYINVGGASDLSVADGDSLLVTSDQQADHIVVQVEGSFLGSSTFAIPKNTRLKELLALIAVDPNFADVDSVSLRRVSVQQRQQASLNESLRRLEATYLGASSSTAEEAGIRVREAELIQNFVRQARQAKPSGRLVVASNSSITDVRLQDGDVITIPEKSDSLLISGEVLVPQSVVFDKHLSAKDYIHGAGGFTRHADKGRILVVRKNGEVRRASEVDFRGGDEILVLPKAPTKNLQLASTISQIVYQIAIAARVAVDI